MYRVWYQKKGFNSQIPKMYNLCIKVYKLCMKYVCICKYVWMFQPTVAASEQILTNEVSIDSSQSSECHRLGDVILNPTWRNLFA